jgi:hypothetical protein
MKKNLTFLTGIVFFIAILVAGSCQNSPKKNASEETGTDPKAEAFDSNDVKIYLKDTLINGTMHLLMSDSKKPDCKIIDNHTAYVHPRYTVTWKIATDSKIDEIKHIRQVGADPTFFGAVPEVDTIEAFRKVYKLVLPDTITYDTIVKYEIVFTLEEDTTTHIIDPYLRIPPEGDPPD